MMLKPLNLLHNYILNGYTLDFYSGTIGEGLIKHIHEYSHLTYCSSGSILVKMQNTELVIDKNTRPVELPSNQWHEIEILEPNTSFVNIFVNNASERIANGAKLTNGEIVRVY